MKYPNHQNFIQQIIKENDVYKHCFFIKDLLYSHRIIEEKPDCYEKRQEELNSTNEKGSLEFILKEDDIEQLKEYVNSHNEFSSSIEINEFAPFLEILNQKQKHFDEINLLDYCSYYGSIKCFKFLKMNMFQYGVYIKEMSICGGNIDIIHEVEESGLLFDYCLLAGLLLL